MSDPRAIGVFDSGVGGLTVFHELVRRIPEESLVYLGDSARVPYGTKSPETVVRYSREAAHFLIELGIKMLVVACNTATAAALPMLSAELDVPVVGVIEPGARAAAAKSRGGRVGVIATEATVRSKAYSMAIRAIDPSIDVIEVACPLFVPLAEEGWASTDVAHAVARIYLGPLVDAGIDTLVLGCTHYPILRSTISDVIGEGIAIVDSAETTAQTVYDALAESNLLVNSGAPGTRRFLVTDAAERFRKIASEFLESPVEHLDLVVIER